MPPRVSSTSIDALGLICLVAGLFVVSTSDFERDTRPEFSTTPQHEAAMVEMEEIGVAMFAYLLDLTLPRELNLGFGCGSIDVAGVPGISHAALESLLVPTYLTSLAELDPWGNAYEFRLAGSLSPNFAAIRSAGSDGLFESTTYLLGYSAGPTEDLVWFDTSWLRRLPLSGDLERQSQATSQIQSIGTAMFSWLTDQLPLTNETQEDRSSLGPSVDLTDYLPISRGDLTTLLVPTYINCVPENDPWGHAYEYWMDTAGLGQPFAAIRSTGRDGLAESDIYPIATFPGDEFDRDLVWADGFWVASPDGTHLTVFSDGFELGLWGVWPTSP